MTRRAIVLACGLGTLWLAAARCWADGGVVRAIETDGPFQISVFTSPNPLVGGTVDISVFVQDAEALAPVPEARIEVMITPRGTAAGAIRREATAEAATNKLFRECLVELAPGQYDVVVTCSATAGRGQVGFDLEVGPAPPQLAVLWPWVAWPVVPILLFAVHQLLAHRRQR